VPTVYWKHFFDWGSELGEKLKALINARKVADVHAGIQFSTQQNARDHSVYAAYAECRKGALFVRIGGSSKDWTPALSDHQNYREYAWGSGWKVWVGLPGNPGSTDGPTERRLASSKIP
jgi:alpha-amylase